MAWQEKEKKQHFCVSNWPLDDRMRLWFIQVTPSAATCQLAIKAKIHLQGKANFTIFKDKQLKLETNRRGMHTFSVQLYTGNGFSWLMASQYWLASYTDVLRGLSCVPAPRTSADLSGKKRRPITAEFQIWEVHFGPWEVSRLTL